MPLAIEYLIHLSKKIIDRLKILYLQPIVQIPIIILCCKRISNTQISLSEYYNITLKGNRFPNHFLNLMGLWQNYLGYWIQVSRSFYENAIRTNEQWLKALWDPWLKARNPSQRERKKIE